MKSRATLWPLAAYAVGAAFAVAALGFSLAAQGGEDVRPFREALADPVIGLLYGAVGALITSRRAGNRVGWSLLLAGSAFFTGTALLSYAEFAFARQPGEGPFLGRVALALWGGHWTVLLTALTLLLLLFPRGVFPSPLWRRIAFVTAIGFGGVFIAMATFFEHFDPPYESFDNPLYIPATEHLGLVLGIWIALLHVVVLAAGVSLLMRFRRSRNEERAQFKWLALAVAFLVVGLGLQAFIEGGGPFLSTIPFWVGQIGVPVTVAIAVLRYHLYDIDRIVSRTLGYGLLTAALASLFVVLVAGLGWLARTTTGQGSNEVAVAATTLIVAALFQPARRRIQSLVDRRFYRSRYDANLIVEAFQSRLRDQTDIDAVRRELTGAVHSALEPASVGVWLRQRSDAT